MKSFLQTKQWADFKKSQGFEIIELDGIFIHKRNIPMGQNFLYIPEVSANDINQENLEELKKLTKEQKSIFLKIEFIDPVNENAGQILQSLNLKKSFEQIQPKWRQIIDINISEDEILAQMKQKGRYNLHLAEKKSVKITKGHNKDDIKAFYDLYTQTTNREKISGRNVKYFEELVDSFASTDYLEIYIASYEKEPVAGAVIVYCDGVASYLYGGSSRRHKEVMAPYLLHWKIIQDAKMRGCHSYDLIGRSKPGDEKSQWAGVTRFKEQLGGQAVEILGSFDFINKPFWYSIYKLVESIRRKNH